MAFNPTQKFPNDTRARVAIGVNIPFNSPSVFQSNYQTKEAIKYSLINYLLTEPGERISNPSFGAGLKKYLFSQITNNNLDFIKQDIQEKINIKFGNLISVEEIIINQPYSTVNSIEINIKYKINYNNIIDNITFEFS